MGAHDQHPLFSGYTSRSSVSYDKVNAGDVDNVAVLNWDRNPHSEQIDILAHGLTKNTSGSRKHTV